MHDQQPKGVLMDEPLYEVVHGERIELPSSAFATEMASQLLLHLHCHAKTKRLGRAIPHTLFDLPSVATQRRPYMAFVSYDRWPRERPLPREEVWRVVPDLAVEIVTAKTKAEELVAKIREYFQAGVQGVWVIYPALEQIYVYESPTKNRILSKNDHLDGEHILPGFRLPVSALFEGEPEG